MGGGASMTDALETESDGTQPGRVPPDRPELIIGGNGAHYYRGQTNAGVAAATPA